MIQTAISCSLVLLLFSSLSPFLLPLLSLSLFVLLSLSLSFSFPPPLSPGEKEARGDKGTQGSARKEKKREIARTCLTGEGKKKESFAAVGNEATTPTDLGLGKGEKANLTEQGMGKEGKEESECTQQIPLALVSLEPQKGEGRFDRFKTFSRDFWKPKNV